MPSSFRFRGLASVAFASAFALVLMTAGIGVARPASAEHTPRPQRIVSLNLCTDQLVLALADREQIAGLTFNAAQPEMSAAASRAHGLRLLGTSAEEVLALEPDFVVGMGSRHSPAFAILRGRNYRWLDLPMTATLDDIRAAIRQTAAALGHPWRGEIEIARMHRELAAIPRLGEGKVAVYYQRSGYVTGTGTLIDELMRRAGLVNLASKLGKPPLSQMSIEEIVAARPDYLIVDGAGEWIGDQGTEMLHHPALRDIPRIAIPQAWTVCGGPAYVLAARGIAEQLAGHQGEGGAHQNRARTPAKAVRPGPA